MVVEVVVGSRAFAVGRGRWVGAEQAAYVPCFRLGGSQVTSACTAAQRTSSSSDRRPIDIAIALGRLWGEGKNLGRSRAAKSTHTHTHSVRLVGTSMTELRRSRCSPGRKWTGARLLHVTAMINQSHTVARSFVRRGLKLDDLRAAGCSVHPPLCCTALR